MDWDILMTNMARGEDFTGQTQSDEDAYFRAFAGEKESAARTRGRERLTGLASLLAGFVSTRFMLR